MFTESQHVYSKVSHPWLPAPQLPSLPAKPSGPAKGSWWPMTTGQGAVQPGVWARQEHSTGRTETSVTERAKAAREPQGSCWSARSSGDGFTVLGPADAAGLRSCSPRAHVPDRAGRKREPEHHDCLGVPLPVHPGLGQGHSSQPVSSGLPPRCQATSDGWSQGPGPGSSFPSVCVTWGSPVLLRASGSSLRPPECRLPQARSR